MRFFIGYQFFYFYLFIVFFLFKIVTNNTLIFTGIRVNTYHEYSKLLRCLVVGLQHINLISQYKNNLFRFFLITNLGKYHNITILNFHEGIQWKLKRLHGIILRSNCACLSSTPPNQLGQFLTTLGFGFIICSFDVQIFIKIVPSDFEIHVLHA